MPATATSRSIMPAPPTMEQALLQARVDQKYASLFRNVELPFTLRPHQITGLQALIHWKRVGLFDEPRTGKTITMQQTAAYFARFKFRSVFLMPPALFDQFLEEFGKLKGHGLRVEIFDYPPKRRLRLLEEIRAGKELVDVLIMSKEIFKSDLTDIMLAGYRALFFDECHIGLQSCKIRTPKKAWTTYGACQYFVDHIHNGRIILSTGSPIYNHLSATYPIISLKSPEAYSSKRDFDYQHVTYRRIQVRGPKGMRDVRIVDPEKYLNLEALHKNLYKQAVRHTKLEVLPVSVPNIQEIPVHLAKPHLTLYRKLIKERILEVEGELIDARQQSKLRQFALQLVTNPRLGTEKPMENLVLKTVDTLLDTAGVLENKVVLFANYNKSVELLSEHLTKSKLNPAVVYGPNGPEKNRIEVKRFKEDPACRVLVANPLAGGVGLTLGHVSQTVILVEPVSTPGQFDQVISRVLLAGQKEPIVVYLLRVLNTISPNAIDLMLGKAKLNQEVLRDPATMLDELLGQS